MNQPSLAPPAAQDELAYYPSNSSSSALRAFAHLPSYEFDYDYRGQTIRPTVLSSLAASLPHHQPPAHHHHPSLHPDHSYDHSPAMDTFDSYMFPAESDSQSSPTEPSEVNTPTYPSTSEDGITSTTTTTTTATTQPLNSPAAHAHGHAHGHTHPAHSTAQYQLPPVDWSVVDTAQLYYADGSNLDPCHLYTGYSTYVILVFVPRQAVELCALVYAKLAHLLQQASCRIMFVTAWVPEQARTFLSRFERVAPFPGSIVCDPDASLFTAFGLTRSPLRALFSGNRVSAPMRQGVRNALSTVTYRAQNRDIATTATSSKRLKVGAVVLSSLRGYTKRPHVVYAAEETPLTGAGCYMDVLSACGVNEAFVPDIDVPQLYARFNSMRATSIKARHADEKEANRLKQNTTNPGMVTATGSNGKNRSSRKGERDRRNALKS